ncbi:MAG: class I SAM-dependent methyltransferase [Candidatus Binatia bacterium]
MLRYFARKAAAPSLKPAPPPVNPVWPLPRRPGGPSDAEIRAQFAKHASWHYTYEFDGGLSFSSHYANLSSQPPGATRRHFQRFRHFMPYLLAAQNGSLKGKRILDMACNSGFWSIQCALLGAEVVGFDGRPELIEQSNLIKSIVGVRNVEFRVLDFWDLSPQSMGGTFDIVFNFGLLYHLPKPVEALQLTKSMARENILLDTAVYRTKKPVIRLEWEEPDDIRNATRSGVVARPSKASIEMMLKHIHVGEAFEIPLHTTDMPPQYIDGRRASWLIKV